MGHLQAVIYSIAVLTATTTFAGTPGRIENGDPQVLIDQAATLKSVVRIETDNELCTASLIDKNILLTARHCVMDEETGKPVIVAGSEMTINGSDVEVEAVLSEAAAEAPIAGTTRTVLTDAAMILFKPKDCGASSTARLPLIALASQSQKKLLSSKVLLAGYGNSNRYHQSYGVLNAGYNFAIYDDLTASDAGKKIQSQKSQFMPGITLDDDEIKIFNEQIQGGVIVDARNGQSIQFKETSLNMSTDSSVGPLEGDSGGPAIAFDGQTPYVIGVVSRGMNNVLNSSIEIRAIDPDGNTLATASIPPRVSDSAANQASFVNAQKMVLIGLLTQGYVDTSLKALKDFTIIESQAALTMDEYVSVLSDPNTAFIQSGLASMRATRDSKQFCQ